MGIFDTILGDVVGGSAGSSPLRPILAEILGGAEPTGPQGASQPGIAGLIERFAQAGHGDTANSWVGNGQNQPIEPGALQHVFGQDQINQWAQQTGMAPGTLLGQLAQFLPAAVSSMTPNGQIPQHGPQAQNPAQPGEPDPFAGPGV